jgi:hypothetical protein
MITPDDFLAPTPLTTEEIERRFEHAAAEAKRRNPGAQAFAVYIPRHSVERARDLAEENRWSVQLERARDEGPAALDRLTLRIPGHEAPRK